MINWINSKHFFHNVRVVQSSQAKNHQCVSFTKWKNNMNNECSMSYRTFQVKVFLFTFGVSVFFSTQDGSYALSVYLIWIWTRRGCVQRPHERLDHHRRLLQRVVPSSPSEPYDSLTCGDVLRIMQIKSVKTSAATLPPPAALCARERWSDLKRIEKVST